MPKLSGPSHPAQRRISRRSPRVRDAIVTAEQIPLIIESQGAISRVVATLICEMGSNATVGAAAVFEDGVCAGPDLA